MLQTEHTLKFVRVRKTPRVLHENGERSVILIRLAEFSPFQMLLCSGLLSDKSWLLSFKSLLLTLVSLSHASHLFGVSTLATVLFPSPKRSKVTKGGGKSFFFTFAVSVLKNSKAEVEQSEINTFCG